MTEQMKAYRPWQILLILFLAALLTGLFFKADVVSPEAHYRYARTLRQFQQLDEQLNSTVVANYAGLLQNYDGMARYLGNLRETGDEMRDIPDWIEADDRQKIEQQITLLMAAYEEKSIEVDRFRRANSVLRNSILYLPQAAESVLDQSSATSKVEFEDFIRRLVGFSLARNLDQVEAQRLSVDLAHLRTLIGTQQHASSMHQVLVHAEVIMKRSPEVEGLVNKIVRVPILELHDQMTRAYLLAYQSATDRAARYRILLYVISLLLMGYALYAVFRIESNRRALRRAHNDLAERYEAQCRAEDELRLYGTVFTHAAEGMTITDEQSRIIAVNPAFCAITGYSAEEVIGHTPALLNSGRQGEAFYQGMWRALQEAGLWQGEIWNRRKDGGIFPEWLSIAAVNDRDGQSKHYIGVFTDISERKESEAQIHHLAHHDALTGLPNRLLLEDRIEQGMLLSRRAGSKMAIIFIDLDRFKNINDTLGHEVGDNLLIQAAERGRLVLRDTDTLCRLGGDEFVAVLPQLENCQDAAHICRKILASFCQPYLLAGHELTVSGSAGIALYPDDGESVSELLRKADAAMYRAKEDGRNTFWYFSAEINTATLGELLLENDLFGALDRDELLMYYQPKVDAQDGKIVAAEALMRWNHREKGIISPVQFIPMAEENGLINAFGEWAIRNVCAQLRAWLDAGLSVVPVAVNISAQQFAQQDLPNMLANVLAEYRLPPRLIELELTESLLMRNSKLAASVLKTLNQMDIKVAIDDFGTGYSSLSYLHQFPVQSLKIDRSFVTLIDEQGESVRLASAIIAMAHELGLTVVAEGVENEVQQRYLAEQGCDELQGYLFGRPEMPEIFSKRLATRALD